MTPQQLLDNMLDELVWARRTLTIKRSTQALRVLKKKMQREGLFREMKNRRSYEKPSERRARESAESTRRVRKLMRKRMEREGF